MGEINCTFGAGGLGLYPIVKVKIEKGIIDF